MAYKWWVWLTSGGCGVQVMGVAYVQVMGVAYKWWVWLTSGGCGLQVVGVAYKWQSSCKLQNVW